MPVVYDQTVIPRIIITNSTDKSLVFSNVTFDNVGFVNPAVYVKGIRQRLTPVNTAYAPVFTVENGKNGNVTLNGLIPNARGSVNFLWTGNEGGYLLATPGVTSSTWIVAAGDAIRPLWAHELTISGASFIGYPEGSSDDYGKVYAWIVSNGANDTGSIAADAAGDIYMDLTAVQFIPVDRL